MIEMSGVRYSSFRNAGVLITKPASYFFSTSVTLECYHKLTMRLA